ncbi:MAG TPA: M23 family metallopeptidase [Nitrospirales bacterium]|nr:M23 family metallopeptidase [Nitrospirales bacterium]HIC04042.1 M23 family metallopeptidase [Nitrospirales bacterium]
MYGSIQSHKHACERIDGTVAGIGTMVLDGMLNTICQRRSPSLELLTCLSVRSAVPAQCGFAGRTVLNILHVAVVVGASGLCAASPLLAEGVGVAPTVFRATQGEIVEIVLSVSDRSTTVTGTWRGTNVPFFSLSDSTTMVGLVGADLASKLGKDALNVTMTSPQGTETRRFFIEVVDASFPVQRLTLPKNMVDLDVATLKRVRKEAKHLRSIFAHTRVPRAWTDSFVAPLDGKISGAFGRRRFINGQKKNPHTGEDISAPQGAQVQASNRGIVRLATEQFFSGKSILIDHGLGLFTMYFHLSEMLVNEGDTVDRGAVIGLVGSTGRATGPHLHWGARLNNARVDPYELIRMNVGSSRTNVRAQ